jgi:L-serine dehydratase
LTADELAAGKDSDEGAPVPYPFKSAVEMLAMAKASGLSIAQMKRANEVSRGCAESLDRGTARIWQVMNACIERGLVGEGILPGGLKVRRRAKGIHDQLLAERGRNLTAPHTINDWMSVYAMAVNEVNAAGGQVVTAPTNGAAGVVPAVIRYWLDFVPGATERLVPDFLLTAAAIGGLVKYNASISGAEAGCQAEVGRAAAMAAAGLCAVMDRLCRRAASLASEF